jgi:hypothetical protein
LTISAEEKVGIDGVGLPALEPESSTIHAHCASAEEPGPVQSSWTRRKKRTRTPAYKVWGFWKLDRRNARCRDPFRAAGWKLYSSALAS